MSTPAPAIPEKEPAAGHTDSQAGTPAQPAQASPPEGDVQALGSDLAQRRPAQSPGRASAGVTDEEAGEQWLADRDAGVAESKEETYEPL
jgi:hypothetical protein